MVEKALLHWAVTVSRATVVGCADLMVVRFPSSRVRRLRGFRFPPEIVALAVRWYLRFGLSYRDVEELLAERGIEVDHVTVFRWVLRVPLLTGHLD